MRRSICVTTAVLVLVGFAAHGLADPYTSATTETAPGVDTLITRPTTSAVSAALSTKEKNTEFKATFLPAQFVEHPYDWYFSEARVVLLADTASSLTRISISTGYNPFSLRSSRGDAAIAATSHDCDGVEIGQELEDCNNRRTAAQWPILNSGWIPSLFLTLSYDVYPFGKAASESDPTQQVDLEWDGGPSGQLSIEFRPCEMLRASAWTSLKHTRADGKPGSEKASYIGGGATFSAIAWSFMQKDAVDFPDDYVQEGFVPGIGAGMSLQFLQCDGDEQCAKQRTLQWSVTPFLDILGSSKVQVRLSLPITRFESVDKKTGTDIAGTFSIAGSIGAP